MYMYICIYMYINLNLRVATLRVATCIYLNFHNIMIVIYYFVNSHNLNLRFATYGIAYALIYLASVRRNSMTESSELLDLLDRMS